ncbi:MAG: lipoprotein-releasing ABC transporter permease subunit [Nitrospirota bacterium]
MNRYLPFEFFISIRYLRAKRRQKGISLTTFISIAGVTVGVAALIATLAVMTGFKNELRDKILGINSHIVVDDRTREGLENVEPLIEVISQNQRVVAATPFIMRQVLLSSSAGAVGVILRGIDPKREAKVTKIAESLIQGKIEDLATSSMLMGVELSSRLSVGLGDTINVISPAGLENQAGIGSIGMTPKIRKFTIVGIFDSGMYEYDSALVYISIPEAQRFFNFEQHVSGIEVKVTDISAAAEIADEIEAVLGFPHQAKDWLKMNRSLFSALKLEKIVMFIILTLIILVASFNIVSTLTMTVLEKGREIAILKAMGASQKSIMRVFMIEGVMIGGVGVLMGLPLGLLICSLLVRFYKLPTDVYYISHLPVAILPFDLIVVSVSALLIAFFATLYPSWQAAKLDPAEALRYE